MNEIKEKVTMISLGCPKNLVDSEVMLGLVQKGGYEITSCEEEADIVIVNTCAFIDSAKEESIEAIFKAAQLKKEGNCKELIVAGCLAQRYSDEIINEINEIDAIIGTGDFSSIVDVIESASRSRPHKSPSETPFNIHDKGIIKKVQKPEYLYDHNAPRMLSTPKHTAYIKIAEGCDNRCAYCIIPSLRGSYRSRPIESIYKETERLVNSGVREIILIAQDTTAYGIDIYGKYSLHELLQELCKIKDLVWIRTLYAYPTSFRPELIRVISEEPKVCKYIDIPLQHASDGVLQKMGRRGRKEEIVGVLDALRNSVPHVTLRSSFMVGFPGETEKDYEELLKFLKEIQFDRVGVFVFSPQEDTPAARMEGQIPDEVKNERFKGAMELQKEISRKKMKERVGKVLEVLVEGPSEESDLVTVGRSQGEAPEIDGLVYIGNEHPPAGAFRRVKIVESGDYDLVGEII